MIGTNRKVRVWAYPKPCDLRNGQNGLSGLVRREFEADLLSGDYFLFVNRRGYLCKVLLWDGTGCSESRYLMDGQARYLMES